MNTETFVFGLLIISTLTSLFTEAMKKLLAENGLKYKPNTLAGLVAIVVSVAVAAAYIVITGTAITSVVVVYVVAIIVMAWLCAMVGYDKVIQTIAQIKANKN